MPTTDEIIDDYLYLEGPLNCPLCDGGVERKQEKLICHMCQNTWSAKDIFKCNKKNLGDLLK